MKNLLIVFVAAIQLIAFAQDKKAFLKDDGKRVTIGNSFIERTVNVAPGNVGTTKIKNKISDKEYSVTSDEIELQIVFAGFGPAYGKNQNGENPSSLTIKDFNYNGYEKAELNDGSKRLTLNFSREDYLFKFRLSVNYEIFPNDFYIRKWIELADSAEGIHFLDRVNVENLVFEDKDFSNGSFGQPLFNKDIFVGVEYPAVETTIEGGKVKSGYLVARKITPEKFVSYKSVIGVSENQNKLEQSFLKYVERIKVRGTRDFLLYNSWYDFRNKAIAESEESFMNEKNVLHRIETFKNIMLDKYGITLDAFVLDDGWDNYRSIWEIDTTTLPHKFNPFLEPLKEMKTALGMWASPFCGYSNRDVRVKWGEEHGYEGTGDFLCFVGKNYKEQFKKKMVEYTRDFHIGYFKWDGFLLACNETQHGHLPGAYSRVALIDTYIEMMREVRKINPDLFINITIGSWLSPWWLQYVDCLWMQGEDYAYAEDVPSMNPRDKAITYRDAVLWDDFQNQNLVFPMSSLMTHGIIKGRLNFLGGKDESLQSFSNEVVMYFMRGVMMWELYVSPDLLSDGEWNAIASSVKYSKANKDVLTNTKMILGNPLKREAYGYVHLTKEKGIILLRNPYVEAKDVEIKLTENLGELDQSKEYYLRVIYPYNFIYSKPVKANQSVKFDLDSYEMKVIELIPADKLSKDLPVGIRYEFTNDGKVTTFSGKENKQSVTTDKNISWDKNENQVTGKTKCKVPENYANSRIAILFEPKEKLQNKAKPELEITVNGKTQELLIEEENGKWFWFSAPVEKGENNIEWKIASDKYKDGKVNVWLFADEILEAKELSVSPSNKEGTLPKPYDSNIKKISSNIYKDIIL